MASEPGSLTKPLPSSAEARVNLTKNALARHEPSYSPVMIVGLEVEILEEILTEWFATSPPQARESPLFGSKIS
jgi:hypothetical protein